jgi:mono/diheme cytochrome c family protein
MQQMASQPAYRPLQASSYFPDGRAARPLVPGTVARGDLRADVAFYTGLTGKTDEATRAAGTVAAAGQPFAAPGLFLAADPYEEEFPLPITKKLLDRGQERFNIFCAVCHDRAGTGEGMIKQRGFTPPPSFHQPRLRHARVGYFFSVITRGYGAMPDYSAQIPPHDRWAIVLYVRTLQIREHAPVAQLPPALVKQLKEGRPK